MRRHASSLVHAITRALAATSAISASASA